MTGREQMRTQDRKKRVEEKTRPGKARRGEKTRQ